MLGLYHVVAFATVVVWGSTFVSTKVLLQDGLTPAQIFTLRFVIAYLLLLAYSLLTKQVKWPTAISLDRELLKRELLMMGLGITGGSLYFLAENEALKYTATTNVSLIVCSCPMVAALIIGMFYKSERMSRLQLAGTVMAVCGVSAVVLNGHYVLHLSPMGDALALVANVCWAVYSLLMIPANKHYGAVLITRKVFFYGLLTMIPYYIMKPESLPCNVLILPRVWGNLLFLGVVASCVCFLTWTWVMNKLGAVVATNYVYLNPVSTIVVAYLVLGEQITAFFLIGTLLILAGMYLADKRAKPKRGTNLC